MNQQSSFEMALSAVLCSVLCVLARAKPTTSRDTLDLRMPHVQPQTDDTYLCYPTKLEDDTLYITGFEPHAAMNVSHHMLLYGCAEPGDQKQVWNCGEMAVTHEDAPSGPVCADGAQIIYAWAMDAPDLKLPKDVAFAVGGETGVNWLVLQVHYKDVSSFTGSDAKTDNSGMTLETTLTPQPKTAGVYLLGTGGEIPGHSTVYMETACTVDTPVVMHPFAYRAHTHTHGEVVSGYRVHDGEWEEIGRVSPKLPQMFYDVADPEITVENGDILAARCTMRNDEDHTVSVGATQNDEMCNFYVMYWVEGASLPENGYCFTDGPPTWSWADFEAIDILQAPENASLVPGSDEVIQASDMLFRETEDTLKEIEEALEQKLIELLSGYDYYDYEPEADMNNPLYKLFLNSEAGLSDYNQDPYYNYLPFDPSNYYGDENAINMADAADATNLSNEELRQRFLDYYNSQQ